MPNKKQGKTNKPSLQKKAKTNKENRQTVDKRAENSFEKPSEGSSKVSYKESPKQLLPEASSDSAAAIEPPGPAGEKLQKVLARLGHGSRRQMEKVISDGQVVVNGVVATLGDRVELTDRIELSGKSIRQNAEEIQRTRILLYNKPEGQICSRADPEGRPTVYDHLPRLKVGRWISVGRLDFNTSGLLLFTNNGELANALMHPSTDIDREYLARVQGEVEDETLQTLRDGVELDDGIAKFTDIKEGKKDTGNNRWFYCVVMEGRNREVRRLWESQNLRVSRLKRVRFGNVFIPSHVRSGQWVELEYKEVRDVYLTAKLDPPKAGKFVPSIKKAQERHVKKLRSSSSTRKKP